MGPSAETAAAGAALSAAARERNPMHCGGSPPGFRWTTTNAAEAVPGVVTPLTWSVFGDNTEGALRLTFHDLGVLPRSGTSPPPLPEDRLWDVFYGRVAANAETFRAVADGIPGTSGSAMEEQLLGSRGGTPDRPRRRRYPVVAAKMPVAVLRLRRRLLPPSRAAEALWSETVAADLRAAGAPQAAFRDAERLFATVMRPHSLSAMLAQSVYERVRALAERAGVPGLELDLIAGYGDMAETDVVSDLWQVSRDRLEIDQFVRRHGFHGPNEGELSSRPWRISREPLLRLLDSYRSMPEDRDPRLMEAGRAEARREAESRLLAALPRTHRRPGRLVLGMAGRIIPLRGIGKAAFLRCADAMRAAARARGEQLAVERAISDPEDVFMLTAEEVAAPEGGPDLGARVEARREIREQYSALELPETWEATPTPGAGTAASPPAGGDRVEGLAVSPGVVEGVARVVLDPASETVEPGEILVCRVTDPGWASTMMLASALVIDIGGAISHGAVVARELGVPCVIGTQTGTAAIATGDRIRVDGAAGVVEILERAAA